MTNKQWFRRYLTHLQGEEFTNQVEWHLRAIRAAMRAGDASKRQGEAAVYRGFLAEDRAAMRARLTGAIMDELGIVPTQHVAKFVMKTCFGMGMDCAMLDFHFSVPGRDASIKYMVPGKRTLAGRPDAVRRYAALYKWYCTAQHRLTQRIKHGGSRRQVQRRLESPTLHQAIQHPTPAPGPQVKRFTTQLPLF